MCFKKKEKNYLKNPLGFVNGRCSDEKIFIPTYKVSKEKAESLGVEFVPLEVSIKETVESLQDKGFIRF